MLPKLSSLPLEISSQVLKPFAAPGEPMVCLQIPSIGNFIPFRMRGRTTRCYRFEWDRTVLSHVLRIPASVWSMENHALARDIYHQMLTRPVIPTLEMPPPAAREEPHDPIPPAKKVARKKAVIRLVHAG